MLVFRAIYATARYERRDTLSSVEEAMMVWKARWLQFALATSTVAILAASAGAQDMTNRLMFGGSFGGMKVIPDSSGIKAKMGPFYGGRLSYGLSSKWLVFAGVTRGWSRDANAGAATEGGKRALVLPYEVGLDYRLMGAKSLTPYLEGSAGTTVWRAFTGDNRTNGGTDFSATGGAGIQWGLAEHAMLDLGAKYHWINKHHDSDMIGNGDRANKYWSVAAALNLVTSPLHAKDSDGDGVADVRDKCPDTPKGAIVDEHGCPKDTDGDGVFDGIDQCPDTQNGCIVDAQGCPKDSDGDGVCDGIDTCPNTPKGAWVDATGCPKDSDGDGVYDGLDQCPGTPAGTTVDANGCPPPAAPVKPEDTGKFLETIYFDFNKFAVRPVDMDVMQHNLAYIKANPDKMVVIHGHTDWIGTDEYNQKLSDRRAQVAYDWLVKNGVDPSRLSMQGHGESQPAADNSTPEGRDKNRRDDFEAK